MRPFEILLLLAISLAFLKLIFPPLRRMYQSGYIAFTPLLITIIQILVEGQRWQMMPAYTLATAFFLIWLLRTLLSKRFLIRKSVAVSFSILSIGLGTLVFMAAIALPILVPIFHFPKPTGPYAIGTLTYHWVDNSRPEIFTADPNDHRELMAQIWYPVSANAKGRRAAYIQHADIWAKDTAHVLGVPAFLFDHFKYITTNAIEAAPIAGDTPYYPVLIYQTGINGFRSVSNFQVEELVSHGYIVVGLDQPGVAASVTYPDGKHITGLPKADIQPFIDQAIWPNAKAPVLGGMTLPDGISPYFGQDASFALDQLAIINKSDTNKILTNHIDMNRVGGFGVSLGGMNTAEACAKEIRFKACLIMDVNIPQKIVQTGLKQPTMFITRDAATIRLERSRTGGWEENYIASTLGTMQAVYNNLPGDGYYVEIPTIFHPNFTDLPYWILPATQLGISGPIGTQHGFDIVNAYSLAFFNKELKGQTSSLLNGSAKRFPEVNLKSRLR